ncbi:MAG: hypothetical protein M3381_13100 [Actinomycetota bacterium]|nr:hypothetical protein [Actinomycetota bacterium]
MAESDGVDGHGTGAPTALLRAAAIVALEGIAVVALGPILAVGGILMSRPDSLSRAWAEVVIAIATGALILFLARGLSQVAGWSRAPVIVIQILAAPVGYSLAFPSGQPLYGIPVIAAAATVLYLLFTPESKLAFFRDIRDR